MHSGKIKKIVHDRGFGFILDTDGRELFFHRNSLVDVQFSELSERQEVEYEVEKTAKGPCAVNVRISQKPQEGEGSEKL